jgi:hypothetical protein
MIAIRIFTSELSVALAARRLYRRRLGGKSTQTASEPLAVQPSSRRRYAFRSRSHDPENLASSAFDEVHVAGHRFTDIIAFRVLGHVVLEVGQRLEFGFEDDGPVAGDGVDHDPAIHETVFGLHRGDGLLETRYQIACFPGLALKNVADEIHAKPPFSGPLRILWFRVKSRSFAACRHTI